MEEDPFYHSQIKKIFPESLKRFVQFVQGERKEKLYGAHLGCYYDNVPNYPYDFVFIDGPRNRKISDDRSTTKKSFQSDLINLLMNSNPNHKINAILDQLVFTYRVFKRLMPKARIQYNPISCMTKIDRVEKADLATQLVEV